MENKAQDKRIELGGKLYDDFVEKLADTFPHLSAHVSNPRTNTCELFALLEKKGMADILMIQMLKEYMSDLNDVKLSVEKGKLYHHFEVKDAI